MLQGPFTHCTDTVKQTGKWTCIRGIWYDDYEWYVVIYHTFKGDRSQLTLTTNIKIKRLMKKNPINKTTERNKTKLQQHETHRGNTTSKCGHTFNVTQYYIKCGHTVSGGRHDDGRHFIRNGGLVRWIFFRKSTLTVCGSTDPENLFHSRIRSDKRTDVNSLSSCIL